MKKLFILAVIALVINITNAQTPLTEAIDFTRNDIHGNEIHLFEILDNGQYVVIDFFFVTCTPCQRIAPIVNLSYNDFGCNSADVFFMSINYENTDEECLLFDETYGVEYPTISGIEGDGTRLCNYYEIQSFPTVILIAPNYEIIEQHIWPIDTVQDINAPILNSGCEFAECPTSVPENELSYFEIYPNPSFGNFNIRFNSAGLKNIRITDLLGKVVMSRNIHIPHNNFIYDVNLMHVTEGLYFISIRDEKNIKTAKIRITN